MTNNERTTNLSNIIKQSSKEKTICAKSFEDNINQLTFTSPDEILLRVACYHEGLPGNKNYKVYKNDKKWMPYNSISFTTY